MKPLISALCVMTMALALVMGLRAYQMHSSPTPEPSPKTNTYKQPAWSVVGCTDTQKHRDRSQCGLVRNQ